LYFIQYLQGTATIYMYLNMSLRLVAMVSSMVTSFLGSVEVVVKEDWDELSEKASVRPLHKDPSHDLQPSRTHTT